MLQKVIDRTLRQPELTAFLQDVRNVNTVAVINIVIHHRHIRRAFVHVHGHMRRQDFESLIPPRIRQI